MARKPKLQDTNERRVAIKTRLDRLIDGPWSPLAVCAVFCATVATLHPEAAEEAIARMEQGLKRG